MKLKSPPRNTYARLALSLALTLFPSGRLLAQVGQPLCSEPECPVAVDIPPVYGTQLTAGNIAYFSADGGTTFKPGIFTITSIDIKKSYMWSDGHSWEPCGHFEYYRAARIGYTIKCQNGITYKDTKEWEVDHHSCTGCGSATESCSRDAENPGTWQSEPIDNATITDGKIYVAAADISTTEQNIISTWNGRKVGIPAYFGGTHKLAVPLVMINGLGFDYRAWGAVPAAGVGTESWRKGLVADYEPGSLPDVASRAYGLAKGSDINQNGLYFLNVSPDFDFNSVTDWTQVLDRLGEIIILHAGSSSNVTPTFKVDIACHSTGCLLLREAIAYADQYQPIYGFHPVDHIRKIISVNAPHLGSSLGKASSDISPTAPETKGLTEFMRQMDNASASNDKVLTAAINVDYSQIAWNKVDGPAAAAAWFGGQLVDWAGDISNWFDGPDIFEWDVDLYGGLFGPHKAKFWGVTLKDDKSLVPAKASLSTLHTTVIKGQTFWNSHRISDDYPKRPDGTYIEFTPFYSDHSNNIEAELLSHAVGGAFSNLCDGIADSKCLDLQQYASSQVKDAAADVLDGRSGIDGVNVTFEPWFTDLIHNLRTGWLANSDIAVEKSSQTWGLNTKKTDASGNEIPQLHLARGYDLHYSEYGLGNPNYPVLHGPLYDAASGAIPSGLKFAQNGAPLMGRDLFCSMEKACQELTGTGRAPLYLGSAVKANLPVLLPDGSNALNVYSQAVDLVGDFNLYLQILSGDQSGVALQDVDGNTLAVVAYDAKNGTYLWVKGPNGGTVTVLLPPDHRPQFVLSRNGQEIKVTLNLADGSQSTVSLGSYTTTVAHVLALGDGLARSSAYLLGNATVANTATQVAPVGYGGIKPWLQERGLSDVNQSRPWLWVTNYTSVVQKNIEVSYYFSADPARHPLAEIDHPRNLAFTQTYLGGDQWKFSVLIPEIPANRTYLEEGLQIRVHNGDWTPWAYSDDYSIGSRFPTASTKVVVKDALGRVIWGEEPPLITTTASAPTSPTGIQLSASFADGGKDEANVLRPRVSITNTGSSGSLPLGTKIVLDLDGLPTMAATPMLEDWYSPEVSGVLQQVSPSHLKVTWTMDAHVLDPSQTLSVGEWGIHYGSNWAPFSKAGVQAILTIVDPSGTSVYGPLSQGH
jgi:hypothetical protein